MTSYAQCLNAGLKICMDCRRNVDNNTAIPGNYHQAMVGATSTNRCAHWLALPVVPRQPAEARA